MKRLSITGLMLAIFLTITVKLTLAAPDEYDESQSHPLRVTAYLVHPIGVVAEWLIFRPFHALVSANEFTENLFGHRPHPSLLPEPQYYYNYGVAKKVSVKPGRAVQPIVAAPMAETVKVVEVPVEKIVTQEVVKEVPRIVEVERVVFAGVAFRFDSAELTDLGKGQVYLAAQRLKEKSDVTIVVEGHTDNVGTDDYNQKLGMRRAETIKQELSRFGIDAGKMSTVSFGESKPLVDQNSAWAHAVNRRVEFQVKAAQ